MGLKAKVAAGLIGVSVLAGCTKTVEEMSYSERQNLASELVKRCVEQGVKVGTKEMNSCTFVEAQREIYGRRTKASNEREAFARLGRGMQAYGAASQANRPVNCTSRRIGYTVSTSCY